MRLRNLFIYNNFKISQLYIKKIIKNIKFKF